MASKSKQTSGLAIASMVLGIISLIPLAGVLLGILSIIFGIVSLGSIKKQQIRGRGFAITGIILGILGILFTIVAYGALFYFGFLADYGPFAEMRPQMDKLILTENAGALELYKNKYGKYPQTLEEASKANYSISSMDSKLSLFCYSVAQDGLSYEMKSTGKDKVCGTSDDILFEN
jgi:hypothetical protein